MILSAIKNGLNTTFNSLIRNTVVEHNTEIWIALIIGQFLPSPEQLPKVELDAFYISPSIGKIRNLLSYDACSTIIHALISSGLDYRNYVLYNVPISITDRLQRLQN